MGAEPDFFTMSSLWELLDFMQHVFPWISLLALLITVLLVMRAEKRKRALRLEQSEEEARIRALDVGDSQKEQLLKAAAPLPATSEAFPLPDLPLRLVSALAKVFGFLKLFLLGGAVYSALRIFVLPGSTRSVEKPVLGILLLIGFIILAVLQIIASTRVTRGSNPARRFLIFMAVLDLGTAMYSAGMAYEALWRAVLIAMSAYTLWALMLRKGAQVAVTYHFSPSRMWQKAALAILCMLLAVGKPLDFNLNFQNTSHKLETNMSSSDLDSSITLPVSRMYLQAGDDSRETAEFMEHFKAHLVVPAELLAFDQAAPHTISGGDLLVVVSKTLDAKKLKKPDDKVDRNILKMLAKSDPVMAQRFAPEPSGDEEIEFSINAPFSQQNFTLAVGIYDLRQMNSPDFRVRVKAEYSQGSRKKTLEEMGASGADKLNEFILKRNSKTILSGMPELLSVEPEPLPAPELHCISNATLKARYCAPDQQINMYRLSDFSSNSYAAVSNELVSAGWKHWSQNKFSRPNHHERITILGPAFYYGQRELPVMYLIYAKSRDPELPANFATDLCRDRYADFISIFREQDVPGDVMLEATLNYLKEPELSAKELNNVYQSIPRTELFDSLRPGLLLRFAEKLHAEPMSEYAFDHYRNLAKAIAEEQTEMSDCVNQIQTLYGDQMDHLELVKDTNGFARAESTMRGLDRPLLVTFSNEDPTGKQEPMELYFLAWVEEKEDGKYKSYGASPGGSSTSEGSVACGGYITLRDYMTRGADGSTSFGATDRWFSIESWTRPGDLTVVYGMDPESGELTVEAAMNENEPEKAVE